MDTSAALTASRNCLHSLHQVLHVHSWVDAGVFMFIFIVVISFYSDVTLAADGGLNKWFSCNFQSSIPTSKTDAIQSIHYQSTADAIRVSQQPLNVYQGQLRPIKPIRHHNVGRRSDEGRALNEASLKRSGKRSCGHWAVSRAQRPSHNQRGVPSSSDLYFFHLIYSSASKPPHSSLLPPLTSAQKHTQSAGIHLVSCSMSKPIVQLRELFQYIACRRPVNQSSLCYHHRALPFPRTHAVSSPAPTYSVPAGQGAIRISARPLLSGPHWAGAPCG